VIQCGSAAKLVATMPLFATAAALQAWKEQLYPLLKQHLAEHVDSSIAYLVLYHEAAVANLLEVRSQKVPAVTWLLGCAPCDNVLLVQQ
jgi:hypothetical protein